MCESGKITSTEREIVQVRTQFDRINVPICCYRGYFGHFVFFLIVKYLQKNICFLVVLYFCA